LSPPIQLGELQLAVLQRLWSHGEASASDLHAALHPTLGLARTTIATVLTKLEKKEVVTHRTEGRQFIYRATLAESDLQSSLVGDLVERVFRGDATELVNHLLVNHLLAERALDGEELDRLKAMIAAAEERREGER
jgi:BlaI family transcriptional regulator, penicillinase repressor